MHHPDHDERYARFLARRHVPVDGLLDEDTTTVAIAQLQYLESLDAAAPVMLMLMSPGGLAACGLALLDAMESLRTPVATCAVGFCGGVAVAVLARGAPGRRACMFGERVSLAPFTDPTGRGSEESARESVRAREAYVASLRRDTRLTEAELARGFSQGLTLTAEQAILAGVVDRLVDDPDELVAPPRKRPWWRRW